MSDVFFLPIEKIDKIKEFIEYTEIFDFVKEEQKIALKIHFGNSSHNNHIPPEYLKGIVEILKEKKAFPFLTDTNVLYRGERADTFSHLKVAYLHNYHTLGIPILIAGGYMGNDEISIKVNYKHFKEIFVATEYTEIDGMIALTHFKGHELASIGGTIKNIGMGCASRKGKFAMHSNITPQIKREKCTGCGTCVKNCPAGAISIEDGKAKIDEKKCIGCAQCIHVCPEKTIEIPWSSVTPQIFDERLVEYAAGIIKFYKGNFCAINFLINITKNCDCCPDPGERIAKDIGVLVSKDPVAIDKASVDLIKEKEGKDVFLKARPDVPYHFQLKYGEEIGLGKTSYKLIPFPD